MNDNKATLEEANAAISKGNFEGFLEFCVDDIIWNMIGDEYLKGKEQVRAWMKKTYSSPPDFNAASWIIQGDVLAVEGDITIKDTNGKSVHSKYCDVWRFRGGKMAELNAYAVEIKHLA
ncbi:ketosteroid isomerase [Bdellovibrio bacteriovorus]|uniref:Ketosteroid isomerase n=1 Tax=Bdellovibrio bacteriovorus TaxID=959 RepID=A0A150WLJ8_BDEBC|nr:nuclear transport factor 2 family protein [Bdellovibrio bacteriovorus]KYG64814.1 ketosteroid isomerase [Bdellovibrio bacteriovorus]